MVGERIKEKTLRGYLGVTDIANIIYKDCKRFGIEVRQKGNEGKGTKERITVRVGSKLGDTYFYKCFVNVNLFTPDIDDRANLVRLGELEHLGARLESRGEYNGCRYRYGIENVEMIKDEELQGHFINVRLLFEVLNVINK